MPEYRSAILNMVPYYYYLVKQGPKVKRSYSSRALVRSDSEDTVMKTLTAYSRKTYLLFKWGKERHLVLHLQR